MLYSIILSLFTIGNLVSCGILDCDNRYESASPSFSDGAFKCADEGSGSCYGPGKVYYGDALTWTYKYLVAGESIFCSNEAFECDPLDLFVKKCYITNVAVGISFYTLKILKSNDDGSNGDGVEEWNVVHDGTNPQITMNVDFYPPAQWNGCNFEVSEILYEPGSGCKPPANTEDPDGFYECKIWGNNNLGLPFAYVSPSVYESGLKYTFNIKMGDYDANGVFDNGPTFDFTYTEPDHRSINDLRENGPITRYFTREGPEGRKARIFVKYSYSSANPGNPWHGLSKKSCN